MPDVSTQIEIVAATPELAESFRQCLDGVARERKWLAITEAFPIEQVREFVVRNIEAENPDFFAVVDGRIVGWADIRRKEPPVARHRGELGMGVAASYRGRGIGTRLLQCALDEARKNGFIRVELGVYAQNAAAVSLYRKLGFAEEGRIVKGRYLDGQFDDVIRMAIVFPENVPPE
jgi:RimJ/RimL family protein N-acetyltransferase